MSRSATVAVGWEVAVDPAFDRVVRRGTVETNASRDWTVKVIADGLRPATTYHYRFLSSGSASPVGRTRTTPVGAVDRLRLGVVSCSNYGYGNFHGYRDLAGRSDLDAIVHLGDYIYEYASVGYGETYGEFRPLDPPHEVVGLDDYRRRYAHYRRDPDLQELHRRFAMIPIWDDHEFADDPYVGGAANHQPATDGDWKQRVDAALQAYHEWMPTRVDDDHIYRTVEFGDLVSLVLTDRQRRFIWPAADDADLYLGREQFDWLDARLAQTTSQWVVLGAQTTFGSTDPDMTTGGWGRRDRGRVFERLASGGSENLIVVSGDTHRALALDLVTDPSSYFAGTGGTAGVEFSCGSISSPGSDLLQPGPAVRWNSGFNRSYLVLDITPEETRGEFYGFFDLAKYLPFCPGEQLLASFTTTNGSNRLASSPQSQVAPTSN